MPLSKRIPPITGVTMADAIKPEQSAKPEQSEQPASPNIDWHKVFSDNSPLANKLNSADKEALFQAGKAIHVETETSEKVGAPTVKNPDTLSKPETNKPGTANPRKEIFDPEVIDNLVGGKNDQLTLVRAPERVADDGPDTYVKALQREAALFASMPAGAYDAAKLRLTTEPGRVALEGGAGLVIGAGMAAITKNPRLLGETLAPYAKPAVRYAGIAMLTVAGIDWTMRIGAPALDTWQEQNSLEANKARLGHNVGTGVVDYGAGIAGGALGARAGWRLTPEWVNAKPQPKIVDDGVPIEAKSPEQYATQRETTMKDDVKALYEQTFSPEERQPTEDIMELVAAGKILIHTSRVASTGELKTMSFTGVHEGPKQTFNNLDFIATAESARGQGIGSLHAKRLTEIVAKEHPEATALTLEVDNPAKLAGEDQLNALAKAKFYNRLGFNDTTVDYNFLAFKDPSFKGPANWRAFVFKPEKFDPIEAARGMYTNEGGYGLKPTDKRVWSLEDANGYWKPEANTLKQSLKAATAAQGTKRAIEAGQEGAR